jgi:hypothetical protein
VRSGDLSHRKLALGSVVFLFSMTAVAAFFATSYPALQAINPIAALTAVIVALIGIIWFKKSSN